MVLIILFWLSLVYGKFKFTSVSGQCFLIFGILFAHNRVDGQVIKYGNVSYQNSVIYDVMNPKNMNLKLFSESGDADLYVFKASQFDKTNINFSDYQFKSDSFGIETIVINKDYDIPSHIVVFGVAQDDSKFVLEISNVISKDLDYSTIDDSLQKSPGSSYEELCLQHSFDSDSYYAEEEKARLKLLSMDTYQTDQEIVTPTNKRKKTSSKDASKLRNQREKHAESRKSSLMEEDSFLYHFLLWLLEFIVDVFF